MNFRDPQSIPKHIRDALPASDPASSRYVPPVAATAAAEEAAHDSQENRQEAGLQADIYAYLTEHRAAGKVHAVIWPPTNRKSQLPPGWPDLTFCYRGRAIGMEVKLPEKKPEPHQFEMHALMAKDGWMIVTVHSVTEAAEAMNQLDILFDLEVPPN